MTTYLIFITIALIILHQSESHSVTLYTQSICDNTWNYIQYTKNESSCINTCLSSNVCMMIRYTYNTSTCHLFNHLCDLIPSKSSIIWIKNQHQPQPMPIPYDDHNISHFINSASNRILATTIQDIWYIPLIIIVLVLICWCCCWILISKYKQRFLIGDIYNRNSDDIADVDLELQELNIESNDSVIDPAKYKSRTNEHNKSSNHGSLIYQNQHYTTAQIQYIKEMNIKCLILFGDNDIDNNRKNGKSRQHFHDDSAIVGKYDRSIAYGICTTFYKRNRPKDDIFKELIDDQFAPLKKYIVSGYDIVIPYASKQDVEKAYYHATYHGTDTEGQYKQLIYHNLGTNIAQLSFDELYYIQMKIMELETYASDITVMDCYGYNPNIYKPECPLCAEVKMFLLKFRNCRHKICEECLKRYIDENLKAYNDNNIDIKFECWAVKLNKCNGNLCLNDINYPKGTSAHLQKHNNGTILDGESYEIYKHIMNAYDPVLCVWDKDICPNEECLKPFKIYNQWKVDDFDDDYDDYDLNIDSSGSIAAGKIFHCNCCAQEIHGVQYHNGSIMDSSEDDLIEEKYDANVFFDIFWCNICEKKFCRKCRKHCFYSLQTPVKYNMKTPDAITEKLCNFEENEELDCCEICWYKYYCRECPHCLYRFCGLCHGEWQGVTKISREQQIYYNKVANTPHTYNGVKAVCVIEGGKDRHDASMHHACEKMLKIRSKWKRYNKTYENAVKNEEIKVLKMKLAEELQRNETLFTEITEMKDELEEVEEKKEFEMQKKDDIAKIERKIATIEKKMKKMNKEAIWEWNDSEDVWRLFDAEMIKTIEELKIGQHFEYTLLANEQRYRITKLSKTTGKQLNMQSKVRRDIRRTERDRNAAAVKYPHFWAQIDKRSYAKPHFSNLKEFDYTLYRSISERFYETVDESVAIIDIESVENRFLWDKYYHARSGMIKLMGEHNINEKELWHGTKYEIIEVICTEGFRKEFNNTSVYGEGTYFARDARYSIGYSKPSRSGNRYRMFLCKVLCGESVIGSNDITLQNWPKKHDDDHELIYDSLIDNIWKPEIYVIHDDIRAYPMYIVHFEKY